VDGLIRGRELIHVVVTVLFILYFYFTWSLPLICNTLLLGIVTLYVARGNVERYGLER